MRLNPPVQPAPGSTPVPNHEGGPGFVPADPRALLVRLCAACFLGEKQFYASGASQAHAIREAAAACPASFVLRLAVWCRSSLRLRTVSQYLLVLGARACAAGPAGEADRALLRRVVPLVCQRADEPGEVLAAWQQLYGSQRNPAARQTLPKVPRALLKGLSDAIGRFNEYQLAKYKGEGRQWSLRNVFRFVRPVPADPARSALYARVVKGELATPETWEVALSVKGASAAAWDDIAPKMGLFALVRNLRNFVQQGATVALDCAVKALHDPAVVTRSKMLPFRFLAALRELEALSDPPLRVLDALREAVELSVASLPRWPGTTVVAVDGSGSMSDTLSAKSKVRRVDVASLFGALAMRFCAPPDGLVEIGTFSNDYRNLAVSPRDSVLTNAARIVASTEGGGTEAWKVLWSLRTRRVRADRIVVLSDEQSYNSHARSISTPVGQRLTPGGIIAVQRAATVTSFAAEWEAYRREVNPRATLVCINLAGYAMAHAPVTAPGVLQLTGWSEQVLGLVPLFERGDALVQEIESFGLSLPRTGAPALADLAEEAEAETEAEV